MDMENQYQKDNYADWLQAELYRYFLSHFKQTVSEQILFTGHLGRKTSKLYVWELYLRLNVI